MDLFQQIQDVIKVIPANPQADKPSAPSQADIDFQRVIDKILGRNASAIDAAQAEVDKNKAVLDRQINITGTGDIWAGAGAGVTAAGAGNNLFDFFSEAGFIYIVGFVLVALAFVLLRKK